MPTIWLVLIWNGKWQNKNRWQTVGKATSSGFRVLILLFFTFKFLQYRQDPALFGMVQTCLKTLYLMGYSSSQLVQDFVHHNFWTFQHGLAMLWRDPRRWCHGGRRDFSELSFRANVEDLLVECWHSGWVMNQEADKMRLHGNEKTHKLDVAAVAQEFVNTDPLCSWIRCVRGRFAKVRLEQEACGVRNLR